MSSTPTSGGKKLVQARLPFQLFRTSPNDSQPPKKKLALPAEAVKVVEDNEDVENIGVVPLVCLDDSPQKKPAMNGLGTIKKVDDLSSGKRKGDDDCIDLESESVKKPKIEEELKGIAVNSITKLRKFQLTVTPRPKKIVTGASEYFPTKPVPDSETPVVPEVVEVEPDIISEQVEVIDVDDADEDGRMDVTAENSVDEASDSETEEANTTEGAAAESGGKEIEVIAISSQETVTEAITPNKKVKIRKKTPKQLEKQKEMEKKREERERLRVEALAKKQQEKEEKQKMKEEKESQRKKELEEKEEAKRKAKEEKEKKRLQEVEMKTEEKKRKEEERKRREEEAQKKKEEEALAKENKFAKEAAVFTTFFTKVDPEKVRKSEGTVVTPDEKVLFKPFAVKNRMRMAPTNRNPLTQARRDVLDSCLELQDVEETYITQLRCGDIVPGKSPNTWPYHQIFQDEDIEVEELPVEMASTERQKPRGPRPKLLQFHENRRPPYWGTWRKKCAKITARHPLGTYKEFEYDVDSDDEWEEEEPGESLHGSDDEKEKDEDNEEDNYDIDNEFFVPHGYLSEDEAPDEHWSVEQQKEKLKLLGEQFDQERSEKTRQLRPVVIGCIWTNSEVDANQKILALLERCRPWTGDDVACPIVIGAATGQDAELAEDEEKTSPSASASRRGAFPAEAIPALIARTHGATVRRKAIAKAFSAAWAADHPDAPILTLASISRKVKELADWVECPEPPMQGRLCWYVSRAVREQHGCGHVVLPSRDPPEEDPDANVAAPSTPKITKFTKVMTEEDRRKSLQAKPATPNTSDCVIIEPDAAPATPSPIVEKALLKLNRFKAPLTPFPSSASSSTEKPAKKRIALFSVPFGVPFAKPMTSTPIDSPSTPPALPAVAPDSPAATDGTVCLSSDTDEAPSSEVCGVGKTDPSGDLQISPIEDEPVVGQKNSEKNPCNDNNSNLDQTQNSEKSLNKTENYDWEAVETNQVQEKLATDDKMEVVPEEPTEKTVE